MNNYEQTAEIRREFDSACKVKRIHYIYPDFVGNEKYIIITNLSDEQLKEKFEMFLPLYTPYILLTKDMWAAYQDFHANEMKYSYRMHCADIYEIDDDRAERKHCELSVPDFTEKLFDDDVRSEEGIVRAAFLTLSSKQQARVKAYVFQNMSFDEIAVQEGKDKKTIYESYMSALKKMKKYLKNTPTNSPPFLRVSEGVISDPDRKHLSNHNN
jgi:hypothetical protein